MEGTSKPDYKLCVEIVAKAGLREMIKPGLLAIFAPIVVGLIFKTLGGGEGKEGGEDKFEDGCKRQTTSVKAENTNKNLPKRRVSFRFNYL